MFIGMHLVKITMFIPKTGSPTITLFQLRSNYHIGLEPQKKTKIFFLGKNNQ